MPSICNILSYKAREDKQLMLLGKMGALNAAKIFRPVPVYNNPTENVAAPFLKGDALLKYLASTFGIKGMTNRGLPLETIQGVLARCMKEKDKNVRGNDLTRGCIASYVEIFRSDIQLSQQGLPDFITDMGYNHLFATKWTEATSKQVYEEATGQLLPQHLQAYKPGFWDWNFQEMSCKAQHTKYGDAVCKTSTKHNITDEGYTSERYYTGLTNLLACTRLGRYQEGLVYGFDLLSHWEHTGGERPADLYLLTAECCGALHCLEAAGVLLEKTCKLVDLSRYQKARIAAVAQGILRHWGCYKEEKILFEDAQIEDKFSAFYADSLRHHLDALIDYSTNTLLIRLTNIHYHRFCDEACSSIQHPNINCAKATRDTLADLKKVLHLASLYLPSGYGEYYTALHQALEAADLTLQLRSPDHAIVQTLLHSSMRLCQLGLTSIDNRTGVDPKKIPLKAFEVMLRFALGLISKPKYVKKMAILNIGVARLTRSRSSLDAGMIHFTVGTLLAILGPPESTKASHHHLKKAQECYGQTTYERSHRYKLAKTIMECLFVRKHHGIKGQEDITDKLLVQNASGDSLTWVYANEWIKDDEPPGEYRGVNIWTTASGWPKRIAEDDENLDGSICFGINSIVDTFKIIL